MHLIVLYKFFIPSIMYKLNTPVLRFKESSSIQILHTTIHVHREGRLKLNLD